MRKRSKREKSSSPLLMRSRRSQCDLAEEGNVIQNVKRPRLVVEAAAKPVCRKRTLLFRELFGNRADSDHRVNRRCPQPSGRLFQDQHARRARLALRHVQQLRKREAWK